MKIVLLPGMDGTGELFREVLAELYPLDAHCLPLPSEGPQDYERLSTTLESSLPNEEFILVAESFSGGIAAHLSTKCLPNLKAIIFVASFLSAPRKITAYIASFLPLQRLTNFPFFNMICRSVFLGRNASNSKIDAFKRVLLSVPQGVLESRLKVIAASRYSGFETSLPSVYIGATNDMLVSSSKRAEFRVAYPKISFVEVEGPHFILQAQPKKGAAAIAGAVHLLTNQTSEGLSGRDALTRAPV